jgi:energy-coupling factor transporter ATP-binding protein EcfA2
MPNTIKYSTTGDTFSLKEGNFFIGVGDVGKGPSTATQTYNGVSPATSGYTVYIYNPTQASNVSFYSANNGAELITFTNGIAGQTFTSVTQCLNWYATQTNYVCVNIDYESIVTNGLSLNLDAGFTPSYTSSGTTWYDLSYSGNNGTLTNGPTYSGDGGGTIVFDGADDYVVRNSSINTGQDFSVFAWIKPGAINVRNGIVGNSYPYSSGVGWFFSTATNYGGTLNTFFISIGSDNAYRTATNSSITLNTWNYIGGTVTNGGQNIKLYSNGIETGYFGGILAANTVNYSTQEFYVGRRYSANPEPFNGSISIVQIYNRVLSATEILQNYNAQKYRYIPLDPDAQAFITAANITNQTQKIAINQLVLDLKSYSLWTI